MAYWGIWNTWPFNEGQATYTAVQGFSSVKQMTDSGVDLSVEDLNLDLTMEQVGNLAQKTRDIVSLELWELVDAVFPEE